MPPDAELSLGLTDAGNAQRFANRHVDKTRYCHAWKKWLVWDGRRWAEDSRGATMELAKETALSIYSDAANARDSDGSKELAKHGNRSLSRESLRAMLDLAQSVPGIPVSPEQLDHDPWLLNVENGTLDLRTGDLHDHDPSDLICKLAPVTYSQREECPRWESFIDQITAGDRDLAAYLQRCVGYSLTGLTSERSLFVLHGVGRNGKSTFIEVLHALLGEYAAVAPTEMLMAKRYDGGIPNDVAALKGSRFVSASEVEEGRRLAEAKVKQLTGGDTITARFLHGEYFAFKATHKLWLATNHKPEIRGTDRGIWDRIRLVPFTVRISDEEVDHGLLRKLKEELRGILAWAVRGCLDWQQAGGLCEPPAVVAATAGYQNEMDLWAPFLDERCVISPASSVSVKDLYGAYVTWCEQNGERSFTQRELTRKLKERGLAEPKHRRSGYVWFGIGLRDVGDAGDANAEVAPYRVGVVRTTSQSTSRTSRTSHLSGPSPAEEAA
jgi:putative DNA primase/helicase